MIVAMFHRRSMPKKILLITPPFTQLNTAYPAAPYLKAFLRSQGHAVFQADLGIELINRIFSREGFSSLFESASKSGNRLSSNSERIIGNKSSYLDTVDLVMSFLQHRDTTLARRLCSDEFLPHASRFDQLPDLEWSFGSSGENDKARFLATLYLEDIGDLIKDAVTPYFGFSRYAEKLGMSAHSFGPLDEALRQPENIIEAWMLELLQKHLSAFSPDVAAITIPFPGNVYAGFKCGQWIKRNCDHTAVVAGGGFVNTELRALSDPAVFDYLDFITLDDGERPFLNILQFLEGTRSAGDLVRTFTRSSRAVIYSDSGEADLPLAQTGFPDYSDLPLDRYLSLIEIANPMHRLWSDGRWNKMTLAHGCYWHKCSFCDTTLDYIKRCETVPVSMLVDRIEQVMAQTGQSGFHFVDEAAPPAVLKDLSLELLRRKIVISWWVNIRFEAAFTADLCRLMAAAGCIAVTGGLETAADRLLKLMNKGVTVRQASVACGNFSSAGILVHAYLMYGFPTQTGQETVDSLEIVRQFFQHGLIQSAFWHAFTATVHSDVGRSPEKYLCRIAGRPGGGFAVNDLVHEDPAGCDHGAFAPGLRKALYNFMHGIGIDFPLDDWFDFKVPRTSVRSNAVEQALRRNPGFDGERLHAGILWLGNQPRLLCEGAGRKGKPAGCRLVFQNKTGDVTVSTTREVAEWLKAVFGAFTMQDRGRMSLQELRQDYEKRFPSSFDHFLRSREWRILRQKGLLLI